MAWVKRSCTRGGSVFRPLQPGGLCSRRIGSAGPGEATLVEAGWPGRSCCWIGSCGSGMIVTPVTGYRKHAAARFRPFCPTALIKSHRASASNRTSKTFGDHKRVSRCLLPMDGFALVVGGRGAMVTQSVLVSLSRIVRAGETRCLLTTMPPRLKIQMVYRRRYRDSGNGCAYHRGERQQSHLRQVKPIHRADRFQCHTMFLSLMRPNHAPSVRKYVR
jgi:hypothetical protein